MKNKKKYLKNKIVIKLIFFFLYNLELGDNENELNNNNNK